jgi:hypothetical protein
LIKNIVLKIRKAEIENKKTKGGGVIWLWLDWFKLLIRC